MLQMCLPCQYPSNSTSVLDSKEFQFESGPSLYSGLSLEASPSQLKHVLQIAGKDHLCHELLMKMTCLGRSLTGSSMTAPCLTCSVRGC